jgi:uncharacterized protein (DUF608 family)
MGRLSEKKQAIMAKQKSGYNSIYHGAWLNHVAFPLGGIGAGMVCLEGTGALSHVSLRHEPDLMNEPVIFAALHAGGVSRVLEGPVPMWKIFGGAGAGRGLGHRTYGLPRFARAAFQARFPFGIVQLSDPSIPVKVALTGWSPFYPGDADNASLPAAALEYRFSNNTKRPLKMVFSFHSANFMKAGDADKSARPFVRPMRGGFVLVQPGAKNVPQHEGHCAIFTTAPDVKIDCAWFRGGWFDPLTMLWNKITSGKTESRKPYSRGSAGNGASLYVPFKLRAGQEKTIRILLVWYVPKTNLRIGADVECSPACGCKKGRKKKAGKYKPWYVSRFKNIAEVAGYWLKNYEVLRKKSRDFCNCFYESTLPPEVMEAVAANLTILKSPTCLRQADGKFWGWEGCSDREGCCHGTCTHVWNYAQAIPHLFPELERGMRETEFIASQQADGHQSFRASLPIRAPDHKFHAAADGQLGGIIKMYREWRISGDTKWMKALWPRVKQSLDYCIAVWDRGHTGTLLEPHHNTYDIEFWGADGMCTSFYLGALQAAIAMGKECAADIGLYERLLARGKRAMEKKLWNGAYFIQKVQWQGLHAQDPVLFKTLLKRTFYTSEALAIMKKEGPKYQYGTGCLSDGVLGDWLARVCGLPPVLARNKVRRHLQSVFKYNFRQDLSAHANPQRPGYALGKEGGLLLCSWPKGKKPSLPFVYSDEVWTGIEYQVAAHLIMMDCMAEGLRIVRAARARYDGRCRNPFDEYECGHWYARAMSSYSLLQAFSGARYDAVEKVLYLRPIMKGDFRSFFSAGTGYGVVGVRGGKPFYRVEAGWLEIKEIRYQPA